MTTTENKTTKTTEPRAAAAPDDATARWLADLLAAIDLVDGGAVRQLDALIEAMPDGPGLFAAQARILQRFNVAVSTPNAPAEVRGVAVGLATGRAESAGSSAALLVSRLGERVKRMLAAGVNSPDAPLVTPDMFSRLGMDVHGRRVGFARSMSPNCPLAGVPPYDGPTSIGTPNGDPHYVLGRTNAAFYRLADVVALTKQMIQHAEDERRERERVERIEAEERRQMFLASPEGQRTRILELEREVARLKADKGAPAG